MHDAMMTEVTWKIFISGIFQQDKNIDEILPHYRFI